MRPVWKEEQLTMGPLVPIFSYRALFSLRLACRCTQAHGVWHGLETTFNPQQGHVLYVVCLLAKQRGSRKQELCIPCSKIHHSPKCKHNCFSGSRGRNSSECGLTASWNPGVLLGNTAWFLRSEKSFFGNCMKKKIWIYIQYPTSILRGCMWTKWEKIPCTLSNFFC